MEPSNKTLDKDLVSGFTTCTNSTVNEGTIASTSDIKLDVPSFIINPIKVSSECLPANLLTVFNDNTDNDNEICMGLPKHTHGTTNTCLDRQNTIFTESTKNVSAETTVTVKNNTEFDKKLNTHSNGGSSNNPPPGDGINRDLIEKVEEHPAMLNDTGKPMQSTLNESQDNERTSFEDEIPFTEEISCIDRTEDSNFHSINSGLYSTKCSETSFDASSECDRDTNSTSDMFKSFESEDLSVSQNVTETCVKVHAPDVVKSISDVSQYDSHIEKINWSFNSTPFYGWGECAYTYAQCALTSTITTLRK